MLLVLCSRAARTGLEGAADTCGEAGGLQRDVGGMGAHDDADVGEREGGERGRGAYGFPWNPPTAQGAWRGSPYGLYGVWVMEEILR